MGTAHNFPVSRPDRPLMMCALGTAYAGLDEFVAQSGAALWVHGHVHNQRDYHLGATRVVCNPRGYVDEPNFSFDPGFVLVV